MLSFSIPSCLPDASVKLITSGVWVRIHSHLLKPYTSLLKIRSAIPARVITTLYSLIGWRLVVKSIWKMPTQSNPKIALKVFRDNSKLKLDIPTCSANYNSHKIGVDIADQYRSYYSTKLITLHNWFHICFWAPDTMLINSFIIYRDLDHVLSLTHKDFQPQVAWEFILFRVHRHSRTLQHQPPLPMASNPLTPPLPPS